MNLHTKILDFLKLDKRILQIFREEINPPNFFDIWQPVNDFFYPYSPFFIPLFIDGGDPSYLGLVYHPFSNRKTVFVKYDLSAGCMWEIARNSNQFLLDILIQSIESKEDIIDSDIEEFANKIEIKLNEKFLKTYEDFYDGDSFETYRFFNLFSTETPAVYIKDSKDYDGDFPTIRSFVNTKKIHLASEFEIDEEVKNIKDIENIPLWLKSDTNKKELFNNYLKKEDLKSAWLTLNSKGWLLKDVAESLEILKSKTDDELFHLVADNWVNGWRNSNSKETDMY